MMLLYDALSVTPIACNGRYVNAPMNPAMSAALSTVCSSKYGLVSTAPTGGGVTFIRKSNVAVIAKTKTVLEVNVVTTMIYGIHNNTELSKMTKNENAMNGGNVYGKCQNSSYLSSFASSAWKILNFSSFLLSSAEDATYSNEAWDAASSRVLALILPNDSTQTTQHSSPEHSLPTRGSLPSVM